MWSSTPRSVWTHVVGYIGGGVIDDVVRHTGQSIPNTGTTTFVLCCTFDLESSTGDSPPNELVSDCKVRNVALTYQK
jgi:hypothetical protein